MEHNCYRLDTNGRLLAGLETTGRFVCVGNGADSSQAISIEDVASPRFEGHLLMEASLAAGAIVGRRVWRGALLHVATCRLEFSEERSTELNIPNAWPGVEQMSTSFVQIGRRNDPRQEQLLVLQHEETAFAADRGQRYIRLFCNNGDLVASPANKKDLAIFLVRRAERRAINRSALAWVCQALENLGMDHMWSATLNKRLAALEKQEG